MSDLIDREKAIEQMSLYGSVWMDYTDDMTKEQVAEKALRASKQALIEVVKRLPSAQPKRGRWILDRSGAYCCSECMEPCAGYVMMKPRDKFCKMCGSRNEVTE